MLNGNKRLKFILIVSKNVKGTKVLYSEFLFVQGCTISVGGVSTMRQHIGCLESYIQVKQHSVVMKARIWQEKLQIMLSQVGKGTHVSRDIFIISCPLTHFQIDLLHLCLSKSFNSVWQLEYLVLLLSIHLGIALRKLFQANKTRGGRRYFNFNGDQYMQLHM